MVTFVVYSHTDFLDILKIQTDYLKTTDNKILLVNTSTLNIDDVCSKYKHVIYYDDSLPYAGRLLSLSNLQHKYIVLTHDIDIVMHKEDCVFDAIIDIADKNSVDSIHLKHYPTLSNNHISVSSNGYTFKLDKHTDPHNYIYNVNPTLWKLSSLLQIMTKFSYKGYREIEHHDVQHFCTKFNVYNLHCDSPLLMGYFECLPFYLHMHITHTGELLPIFNNGLNEKYNDEYKKICETYLKNGKRRFRRTRW